MSTWADIGKRVLGMGLPLLGGVLGGPAGSSLGGMVAHALGVSQATPDAVATALESPAAAAKLRILEAEQRVQLATLASHQAMASMAATTAREGAVNATMRAEATSEHWLQWSWRPVDGILFAPTILGVYFLLPLLHVVPPAVPQAAWIMWGSLLGITSWHRGMRKRRLAGDTTDALGRRP